MMDLRPLVLSFELAFITTLLLFVIGIPLAYWLSGSDFKLKPVIAAIVSMPLVLPPTVLGFYLLVAFSPLHFPGNLINELFNIRLVFSFEGLIIASMIYSLPFMVNPIQSGLESLPSNLKEAS
ncbi:MAG TPA: ABC transporter permease subunit, partial [Ignavibacteria bacterium]|nr:ABC transporter permease subunit [Ignavibacteria bacterium]